MQSDTRSRLFEFLAHGLVSLRLDFPPCYLNLPLSSCLVILQELCFNILKRLVRLLKVFLCSGECYDIFVFLVSIACFILISGEFSGWGINSISGDCCFKCQRRTIAGKHNITVVIIFPLEETILWIAAESISNLR